MYETSKRADKRDDILRICEGNAAIESGVSGFFGILWDDFEGGTAAQGLARLGSAPPPGYAHLTEKHGQYLWELLGCAQVSSRKLAHQLHLQRPATELFSRL